MPLVFSDEFVVLQFECDPWDRMTPGAILRRVQEVSTAQCEALGLNRALYQKTNTVFLLSLVSLETYKAPKAYQKVDVKTRAYEMRRAVFTRMTTLYDEYGEKLCEVDARWVLVNTQTHTILRKEPEGFPTPYAGMVCEEGHSNKMPKAENLQECATLVASYSLCDRNGHMNNSRYADILCDRLPIEKLAAAPVRKMLLRYRSEIPLQSTFTLFCGEEEGGYSFAAVREGNKDFEGFVTF